MLQKLKRAITQLLFLIKGALVIGQNSNFLMEMQRMLLNQNARRWDVLQLAIKCNVSPEYALFLIAGFNKQNNIIVGQELTPLKEHSLLFPVSNSEAYLEILSRVIPEDRLLFGVSVESLGILRKKLQELVNLVGDNELVRFTDLQEIQQNLPFEELELISQAIIEGEEQVIFNLPTIIINREDGPVNVPFVLVNGCISLQDVTLRMKHPIIGQQDQEQEDLSEDSGVIAI